MAQPERLRGRIISHYRIQEKIGAGGMGEVYRAHDEQLDRDIALKVLPCGTVADEVTRKQFRKEALALAKLNHPNIATVFEFSSQDDVDFLAMELIAGLPVSDRLKDGPLPQPEVLQLGAQLAEGLAAAHDQDIIHRDLKPANLFVTPDGRLKILDFGLATFAHPNLAGDVTQTTALDAGAISGTVPYMSPEQLRGLPVDPRSDIYAAGAILYEMATGVRPFPQTQGAELMGAILHEPPVTPSSVNSQISPGLENIIAKSLKKDPSQRYQSARELRTALESISNVPAQAISSQAILAGTSAPSRSFVYAGVAFLVLLVAAGFVLGLNVRGWRDRLFGLGRTPSSVSGPSPQIHARRSVAVLGFKNLSGRPDEAWLSTALSEMLSTELAAGGQLRTIPGENVGQMKISLSLPDADGYGKQTLAKIRRNLGSDEVVLGSYLALGNGQLRLDVRLEDASSGEIVDSFTKTGKEEEVADLVSSAGASLRQKLGAGELSADDAAAVKATLPSNTETARLYAEGLTYLRTFDNLGARVALEKAVAADPKFAIAHAALATAWSQLGYDDKARDEGKKALALSESLSHQDSLWVEGQYREAVKEWPRAIDVFHTLFGSYPDNLDYGLRLANAQASGGKGHDALATLEVLRKLPPPAADDPRIDKAECSAADSLGDFKGEIAAAEKAAAKGRAQGATLLVARALDDQCWATRQIGDLKKAIGLCEEARDLYSRTGDRNGTAGVLNTIAVIQNDQGDHEAAIAEYNRALALARETGSRRAIAADLNNMALALWAEGNLARANSMFDEAFRINSEIGRKASASRNVGNLGLVLLQMGQVSRARAAEEKALAIAKEVGDKETISHWYWGLGDVLFHSGDLPEASRDLNQAISIAREIQNRRNLDGAETTLGEILFEQADLSGARDKFQRVLATKTGLGEKSDVAVLQLSLTEISIEEGHAADREPFCREAIAVLRAAKEVGNEIQAHSTLSEVFLATSRPAEAQKEIAAAEPLVAKSQNRESNLQFAIVAARVLAATGSKAEAAKSLEALAKRAAAYGFVHYGFWARLALGEINMKSGKAARGRALLSTLEKEATAKGFLLIAHKASAAGK
jgi:serine/threonine protein kinase/tetratricopeptide (TPR) repeat protein